MKRLLAVDPGAHRCGWAMLSVREGEKPLVEDSGVFGLERKKDEPFQDYKMRLIDYWAIKTPVLLRRHRPTSVVSEIVPAVGGGSFIAATQSELAKTGVTIIQAFAMAQGLTVRQIGATTVKKNLTGNGKATKAKVRDAVIERFPDLGPELRKETTAKPAVWDRSDAIAIGIAYLDMVD